MSTQSALWADSSSNPVGEHYTRRTVSAASWCGKCQKNTQHRVDDRRLGPCLECVAKLDATHSARGDPPASPGGGNALHQTSLFHGVTS